MWSLEFVVQIVLEGDAIVDLSFTLTFIFFFSIDIFKNLKTLSPGTNILEVPGKKQKEIPN